MIFVEVRLLVVHPLPTDWAGYDELLAGLYTYVAFIVILLWAVHKRRQPAWHKRLMTIATFVALVAPIERMEWLPELGVGYVWASVIWLDMCLIVPLVGYDVVSTKRPHQATVQGLGVMLCAQALAFLAWGTAPWHHFAFAAAHVLRSTFGGV
jgi:small-conductance mechanosensitive channel